MYYCQIPDALCYLSVEFCLAEMLKAFLYNLEDYRFSWFCILSFHLSSLKCFCLLCISVIAPSISLLSPENFAYLSWLFLCYNVKVKILALLSVPYATLLCLHLISFPCVPQLTFHIPHSPLTLLLLLSAFHALIFVLSFMLPMCLEQSLASQPIYSFA